MAVSLRELYRQARRFDVRLVAGEAGLDGAVHWVHMVESTEVTNFLDPRDLACTTGIGLHDDEDLLELVRGAYEHDGSGIIVNVGPYIPAIPPVVREFCENHGYPLFSVPWRVHLAQVMHAISLRITLSEKADAELSLAMKNAIFRPAQEELYLDQLEVAGFRADRPYTVSVVRGRERGSLDADVAAHAVANLAASHGWEAVCLSLEGSLALVLAGSEAEEACARTTEALSLLSRQAGTGLFAGQGKTARSARSIGASYRQAVALAGIASHREGEGVLLDFDHSGIFRLLLAVGDDEALKAYRDATLGPLLRYDQTHAAGLVGVLRTYLAASGSVRRTAGQLFVHRNTVTYKLNKIAEVLGCDLSLLSSREELAVALAIDELLGA